MDRSFKLNWLLFLLVCFVSACSAGQGGAGEPLDISETGTAEQRLCSSPGLVSNVPTYQAPAGTSVIWAASASCAMAFPQYRFVFRNPSNTWIQAQDWSTQNSYLWNTTGLADGVYDWQVWIREAGSTAVYETYTGRPFAVTNVSPCTAVTSTPSPNSPVVPGTAVTVTNSATCSGGTVPEFRVLRAAPGQAFQEVQAYSTSPTYNWNTTGLALGRYSYQVWVRGQGSPSAYTAYTGFTYELSASPACTAATLGVSPPSPALIGSTVTFTGGSSSCGSPQFRFLYLPPGGAWTEGQAYGASPTFAFNTTGKPAGSYSFQVWVRRAGSTVAYETYAGFSYTLTNTTPCSGATLSASPVSPSPLGTSVTFTGGSSGCTSPQYRFVYLPPGGVWTQGQDYSASPTFVWNTSALASGTYAVQVWVRATGSTASYETYVSKGYTLTFTASAPITKVTGGIIHECTVREDGSVNCWGNNGNGQLGNGSTNTSLVPVAVTSVTGATGIGGGYYHTCAIVSGGAVQCWGAGTLGQMGNGTSASSANAVPVSGLTNVVALSTGAAAHTCAALSNGGVRCWGYDSQGQLGSGAITNVSSTPVTVTGITGAVSTSTGYYHSCALLSGGTVRCWGLNSSGQLGNGTTTNSLTPVTVSGLKDVTSISSANGFNCAVRSDKTVSCWGKGVSTAAVVPGLSNVSTVSVGPAHTCATLGDGSLRCWGANTSGQLGDGTTTTSSSPVTVGGLSGKTASGVAAAGNSSCALFTDATAYCWGDGTHGELGNGGSVSSSMPVLVSLP